MAYKEKDTKKWTAQWFETNAKGEKKKRRKKKNKIMRNFISVKDIGDLKEAVKEALEIKADRYKYFFRTISHWPLAFLWCRQSRLI